ncbi:fungal zn(2)-cys(6) binuclear cluster domain protein, putative [Rhizoctonia solani AG-3 Rhs1AP]|uniref:Fungal zn(2)-cys(6) binuclear cluster domain protein, putative n=1 Tax=Rhizoctonia solani AG-3 Rhs1AP TaxID=1086054 RepID=X8J0L6_9AGAM|nr:fungal zn(2)-cys(6) binuclear cluster domain protein, putative [Rhizoctonia solani AG-3 Rhs1AP]
MSNFIPKRSIGGCLTCKRRKKKCDERRPYCRKCEIGDFHCLGYSPPETSHAGESSSAAFFWPSHTPVGQPDGAACLQSSDPLIPLPDPQNEVEQMSLTCIPFQQARPPLSNIPRGVLLDPIAFEDVTGFIMSQYVGLSREVLFRGFLFSLEEGIWRRISNSNITRWSMYLGARVIADLSSGTNAQRYLGWIFRFFQQITVTSTWAEPAPSLQGRLGSLYDLVCLGSTISGSATGYSLLQRSTPVFVQLAALDPKIWVDDSSISIPKVFRSSQYEVIQFVVHDTFTALTLGTPPQLQYDTTSVWVDKTPGHYMEWVYGFPVGVLILLAEINAWRTSRMIGKVAQNQSDCRSIEDRLKSWSPIVDNTDEPSNDIVRLAVREAWRQATLIYLYLGMNEANSADPRVERAVKQVVQLASTVTKGSSLELHFLAPSLIAGVAARQEKHRAVLRSRVASEHSRKLNSLLLPVRGADFIAVLDHLWHGVGSGGSPITWNDYVKSRFTVLPLHDEPQS